MFLENSIKSGCKNLCLHPKPFKITFKLNSYVMSFSHRGPVTPSAPFSPNINPTKQIKIYLLFQKSLKNSCNDLYFHLYMFDMIRKSFYFLTLLSCHSYVNASIVNFGSINLTETKTSLLVAWKIDQKWQK